MTRALFLDRDGTLVVDTGYPRDPRLVEPLPGAREVLGELQQMFALVIVSNQSGIGRGLITDDEARAVHDRVMEVFRDAGVRFTGAYYCPHTPDDGCRCRKPRPGLLERAADELGVDLAHSFMLGDAASDVAAGVAAGCRTIVFGNAGSARGVHCPDWPGVRDYLDRVRA